MLNDKQKQILKRLEELYEAQRPFVEAVSADVANANPVSFAELEAYGKRADEIASLHAELIASMKG